MKTTTRRTGAVASYAKRPHTLTRALHTQGLAVEPRAVAPSRPEPAKTAIPLSSGHSIGAETLSPQALLEYLTNPHVGHLGIFVSASVARLEHRATLERLAGIEALAPGLYEMKIDNPSGDPDCHKPACHVRFEPRRVEDLGGTRKTAHLNA